jgi:hypothetical protein
LAQHLEPENGNPPVTPPVDTALSSLDGVELRYNRRNRQADEDEIPF